MNVGYFEKKNGNLNINPPKQQEHRISRELITKIGMTQGGVLSPFLYIAVMDEELRKNMNGSQKPTADIDGEFQIFGIIVLAIVNNCRCPSEILIP